MFDHRLHLAAADEQRAKRVFREPCLRENLFDRERAAWHIRRVLENADVPRHQGRRREPEDLPKRKIPRHHRQHDAERIERQVGFGRLSLDDFRGELRLGMLCVKVARPRAFLGLGHALLQRLAHFHRHQRGELVLTSPEDLGRVFHRLRALGKRRLPPRSPGIVHLRDDRRGLLRRHFFVGFDRVACDGIHRRDRHHRSSASALATASRSSGASGSTALGKNATTRPFLSTTYLLKFHAGRWPEAPRN